MRVCVCGACTYAARTIHASAEGRERGTFWSLDPVHADVASKTFSVNTM